MLRDVNLIKHLPPFLQDYLEMKIIMDSENPEFQKVMDESERIKDNTFILTADSEGLRRFEKILNIYVAKDEDLESRRLRVLSRWNDIAPYTFNALISKLRSLHNSDNFIINKKFKQYEIEIITHLEFPGQVTELDRILDYIIPANLIVDSKNRIYCNAQGEAFTSSGLAHASIFEITDQYDIDFELIGHNGVATSHSITQIFENDESYHEDFETSGNYAVGNNVSQVTKIEADESYHENLLINGKSQSALNVGNVEVITTEG